MKRNNLIICQNNLQKNIILIETFKIPIWLAMVKTSLMKENFCDVYVIKGINQSSNHRTNENIS